MPNKICKLLIAKCITNSHCRVSETYFRKPRSIDMWTVDICKIMPCNQQFTKAQELLLNEQMSVH